MAGEGIGGRRHRRRWMWLGVCAAVLLVASLAYAVRQVSGGQKLDPADTAALLGLPVAVAALLAGVLALRRAPEGDLANLSRGWAATLATQVRNSEEKQWRQLLGDDTQRINLAFTVRAAPTRTATVPADAGRLFDGTPTVPDVAAYYRRTHPRRLVVTGAPGAGKTVLVLELMLALLEERGEDEPVPVRVSPAEWDTRTPLPELLVGRLVDVYDWDPARADALVRHHRVLPVLDGLDEMDPTRPDGTPSPDVPRALAALDALNAYQEGRDAGPLVLTCRTAHYDALAPHTRLLDAARVDIDAVPALDACTYLRARTSTPARWEPVLTALRDDPAGPLSTTLSTPWRLCLAATVYARDGDPAELLQHTTPEELDAHLLARFIPAAGSLYPHRRYDAARVHHWLARLAAHLDTPSGSTGPPGAHPGTDVVLHELWPLAGRLRVRAADALLTATAALLPWIALLPLLRLLPASLDPPATDVGVDIAVRVQVDLARGEFFMYLLVAVLMVLGTVLVFGVFAGLAAARARQPVPKHLEWRLLKTRSGLRRFWAGLGRRLLMGLQWGIGGALAVLYLYPAYVGFLARIDVGSLASLLEMPSDAFAPVSPGDLYRDSFQNPLALAQLGLALGSLGGIVTGVLGGLVDGASGEPAGTALPHTVMRRGMPHAVMAGVASGFSGALLGIFLLSTMEPTLIPSLQIVGIEAFLPSSINVAAFCGVAVGLVVGLAVTLVKAAPLRRYVVFLICARGALPWRLGQFLNWCCTAGLLRLSGTAYQFRHRELQQWLTDHPDHPAPGRS
ncbi:NACHT domain-containing protein [Streptomyces lancefieldiae]|uniref:NACHT domain-containing protein n=1 Tax=Streptomyces lancefieldiae TaxID=3075520 RepID=A0ABU3AHC1_9ACTN|nr:NACHT domain-containing protein [Streptomyces sp. DSM 40712]MDT0609374.1 NACHT domain-containing protein [Streptomyces sp. DSM 40712]